VGRELLTRVTIDGARRERVRVHLDSRALQIGGRPSVSVALSGVQALDVRGSELRLATAEGIFEIELGEQAAAWAAKIRSPPSRAQKLGLAAGQRVALVGLDDAALKAEVSAAGARRVEPSSGVDLVFLRAETSADLESLPGLVEQLPPAGALWIVRRKGHGAALGEGDVRAAGRAAGLVDVKVVAFSDTHSADKFVLPASTRAMRAMVGSGRRLAPPVASKTDKRADEPPKRADVPAPAPAKRAARAPAAAKPAARAPQQRATPQRATEKRAGKRPAKKRAAAKPTKQRAATKR